MLLVLLQVKRLWGKKLQGNSQNLLGGVAYFIREAGVPLAAVIVRFGFLISSVSS